jgi:long-chain fatty acid transport protein
MKNALVVVAAALAAAGPALATNGMRMPGFGPVQNSMAGIGVGATLDTSAIVSNPAGLIGLPAQISLGGTYFKPSVSYSATETPLPPGFTGAVVAQPGVKIDSQRGASPIPSLVVVSPVSERLVAGIGVFGISGMGVDYGANLYGGSTYTSYLQARLTPALAYKATDSLSLGVAVNAMAAQIGWNTAAGFGQQPHGTSTSYGIGATAGAKLAVSEWLALGAAYESRSYFRDYSFDVGAHQGVNPATFQPVQVPAGKDKLSFDQPMSAAVGFVLTPVDGFLFAGDVQWINWSATNGENRPVFSQNQSGAMPWDMGWSDQWVFKVGVQVAPTDKLRVRAGYNYGKMPLDPHCAFENLAFPAVSEHHFALGAGYDFGRLTLNAGASYSPKATLSGSNADLPANGGQAIQSYTTEMSQVAFDAGLTWRL